MNERRRNIFVGLTAVAGLVGLAGLLMIFGYLPAILERGYLVHIDLPRAAGLHEGSRVKFVGIDVGVVESIELRSVPHPGVVVTARIRPDVIVPGNVRVAVTSPFFGGGASIELSPPAELDSQAVGPLPTDGSAQLEGQVPNFASAMAQQLQSTLEGPLANLETLTRQFETLSDEWSAVGRNINALVEPRDPDDVDRGQASGNLATVLARTDQRLAELEQVLAGVNAYVNDAQLRQDIRKAAANARELTDKATGSLDALESRYVAVADNLSAAITSMKKVADDARRPDGTLGRMLADPSLYNNLNDAAERLKKAVDDVRLLVEKWKAEGLPVDLF